MTEHSPLPWRTDREGLDTMIRAEDAVIVALRHRLPSKLHVANFDFIVRAVNSHYDLVKALERARRDVFNDIVLKEINTALSLAKGEGHGK